MPARTTMMPCNNAMATQPCYPQRPWPSHATCSRAARYNSSPPPPRHGVPAVPTTATIGGKGTTAAPGNKTSLASCSTEVLSSVQCAVLSCVAAVHHITMPSELPSE
jgi:hypothetical protein